MGDAAPGKDLERCQTGAQRDIDRRRLSTRPYNPRHWFRESRSSHGVSKDQVHEGLQAGLFSQLLRHVDSCRLCLLHSVASDGGSQ